MAAHRHIYNYSYNQASLTINVSNVIINLLDSISQGEMSWIGSKRYMCVINHYECVFYLKNVFQNL